AGRLRHQGDFLLRLLYVIFPDIRRPRGLGCAHQLRTLGFGRTHDGHRLRGAATAARRLRHLLAHTAVARGDLDPHYWRACWGLRSPAVRKASCTSSIGRPTTLVYDPSTRSTREAPKPCTA